MVTVVKTPSGHKIVDTTLDATIVEGSGFAVVTFPYHSLTTGDYVYITSDIDEYNGFWYAEVLDYQSFLIREHAEADNVEFYQEVDVELYRTQPHDWNSIFLPIVYKVTNNRWPVNSADTARTVVSTSDDNGFTELTVSGVLKVEGMRILEFVKITGMADPDLNSIWQIVEVISPTSIVINLPYSIHNSFSAGLVQYYYNNYQVRVKVWAGLDALHPWAAKKPYEEMAELSLTPDDDNEVMFSVSDYIKSKVQVKNNLTLFSLPLNLDAFTGFYIQTAESFDSSDNYSLATNTSEFATDEFAYYAVAGKLPFKNTYSGDYSDYVLTNGSPALWLTNATRLLAVEDLYFDISFIKNIRGDFWIIIDKYVSDYLAITEVQVFQDQGVGVYRIPIVPDTAYDSFCVRAHTPGVPDSELPVASLFDICDWSNVTFGWVKDAYCVWNISVNGNAGESGWLAGTFINTPGYTYEFTVSLEITIDTPPPISEVIYAFLDGTFTPVDSVTYNYTDTGVKTETFSLVANTGAAYLAVFVRNNTPIATKNYALLSVDYDAEVVPPDDGIDEQDITEEICIDLLENCEAQQGFSDEDARLLEDGDFRLLE